MLNSNDSSSMFVIASKMQDNFGIIDYAVFLLLLLISGGIGVYYAIGGQQKTASDFLLGDRKLGVFPVALSLFSSFISAIALLGIPAGTFLCLTIKIPYNTHLNICIIFEHISEVYMYGLQIWANVLFLPVIMFCAAYLFIPVFYELGLTSSYEVTNDHSSTYCTYRQFYATL